MPDGTVHKAWVYVMPAEHAKGYPLWKQGGALDWSDDYRREIEQRSVERRRAQEEMTDDLS